MPRRSDLLQSLPDGPECYCIYDKKEKIYCNDLPGDVLVA